ncbi:hypothetical protein SOASR029_40350 [Budvicia aquatica]|uniref:Uncharacterized protein n=1 Tax=Budvicia aquatica TaxID=82979 RepID=A0A2C6CVX2_9GAMM|nr:hypothetical protein CRN84_16365 [Budvicia aquatica]GKX53726.1 hypothetical protein SOASR029_40350 [Budvicia aquatica]
MLLKRLLDFCLPRFVTEEVVFEELFYLGELESWSPACSLDEIKPGERYEKIGMVRSFKFLGMSYGCQVVGELRDYNPKA